MPSSLKKLVYKEFLLEYRKKYAINGIILYLVSTVFIAYLSFQVSAGNLKPETWNALFWIILLFTAVNAVAKSFMQEPPGRHLYLYQTSSPQAQIISKQIYNTILLTGLGLISFLIFSVVFSNPVTNLGLFVLNLVLACVGFSLSLTLLSAIASKAGNNATLMAVLSFPVLLPMLLIVIRISQTSFSASTILLNGSILVLLAINAIVAATSYILFPYLWRS